MSDQTIFNQNIGEQTPASQEQNSAANTETPAQSNPWDDLLKEIKNEKGEPKYKSVEDALNGLKHAQEFIPKIKQEKTEAELEIEAMKAELSRLKGLEETVFELTQKKEQTPTSGVALNEEDIAKLVEQTLTKKQQEEFRVKNQKAVVEAMNQKFGKDAQQVFYGKAQELGLSVEEMNELAAKTPKAVLSLLGVSETGAHKQPSLSPTQSRINSEGFQQAPQTYLGREETRVMIGATTDDIKQSVDRAAKLAEELRTKGLSTYDLTDPKIYSKYFK